MDSIYRMRKCTAPLSRKRRTAFFVRERSRQGQDSNDSPADSDPERLAIDFLVIGKRMGLSFAEMNELRVSDLLDMAGVYAGSESETPREATQSDIDAFYG